MPDAIASVNPAVDPDVDPPLVVEDHRDSAEARALRAGARTRDRLIIDNRRGR